VNERGRCIDRASKRIFSRGRFIVLNGPTRLHTRLVAKYLLNRLPKLHQRLARFHRICAVRANIVATSCNAIQAPTLSAMNPHGREQQAPVGGPVDTVAFTVARFSGSIEYVAFAM